MSSEEFPVETILEGVDAEMSTSRQPKVILFDIGGVCVVSPFQAILDYELSLGIPPGWVNYSISKSAPDGYWHRLETGKIPMDAAFFAGFNQDLHNPDLWKAFYQAQQQKQKQKQQASGDSSSPEAQEQIPPMPTLDGELLFHEMMSASHHPDPWMFPALRNLKASGRYVIAALSNTVIFPPGHALHRPDHKRNADPVRGLFDVFVSSAHVGLRKPDPRIYELALRRVREFAGEEIAPGDVLFLDDIGENLKAARRAGFRTIKVILGRAYEAVEQLEEITGLELAGDHPKVPVLPRVGGSDGVNAKAKAKI